MNMSVRMPLTVLLFTVIGTLAVVACGGSSEPGAEDKGTSAGGAQESGPDFPFGPSEPLATATSIVSCPSGGEVTWKDVQDHLDDDVSVIGNVFAAQEIPGVGMDLSLGDSNQPQDAVILRVPQDSFGNFDLPPDQLYVGKTVCVEGVVQLIDGRHVLVLDSDRHIVSLGESRPVATP